MLAGQIARIEISAERLQNCADAAHNERNGQRAPVEEIVPVALQQKSVNTRNSKGGGHVSSNGHVNRFGKPSRIKHRRNRINVHRFAIFEPKTGGRVHPAIDGNDKDR